MRSVNVGVIREAFSKDKELYSVVRQFELLQAIARKDKSGDSYEACIDAGRNLQSLLQEVLNVNNQHIVTCRTENNSVWIIELDYFDDGEDLFLVTDWPSMDELQDNGTDSLKGEIVTISWLSNIIQEDFEKEHLLMENELGNLVDFLDEIGNDDIVEVN